MREYKKPEYNTDDEILEAIFTAARDYFCNGIYISSDNHECGFDFLSFEDLDDWTELKNKVIGYDGYELNNGKYYMAEENDKYLLDVLINNGWKFAFEREDIGWL